MRKSKTLKRIRDGQYVRICGLGHFHPPYICHAANNGFDCIWLDLEHRCMGTREVQCLITTCHLYDIDCMIRPPDTIATHLYRFLEDGATGLMIPHISTVADTENVVESVRFPPIGRRGLDGTGFDSNYSLEGGDDYPKQANDETFLIAQIETLEAVENVQSIAAVHGIDGLFVGPGDLSLRMLHSKTNSGISQIIDLVAKAAADKKKAWGCPVSSIEEIKKMNECGAQFIARGSDFQGLKQYLETLAYDFETVFPR